MREYDLIRGLADRFPRSGMQKNRPFECDAEILQLGDGLWGMTMDDFSPQEDLFSSADPRRLGHNLVVATLSDLYAAGVRPSIFMHALSIEKDIAPDFLSSLLDGIRDALADADCALCGGDIGQADPWRFCGFAMGSVPSGKPLTRQLPSAVQSLWITGELGDANLAAFRQTETPAFELRRRAAEYIASRASGCIDTSGGLFDALWCLHEQNSHLRLEIDLAAIPHAEGVAETAEAHGFPPEAALLGGAGEYELLFALPQSVSDSSESELLSLGASRIGVAEPDPDGELRNLRRDCEDVVMDKPPPCPRSAGSVESHLREVMEMAASLFEQGGRG